jgi:hypothetical protein
MKISPSATTTCSETGLSATLGEARSELALTPSYASCKTAGLSTAANMHSCHYTLEVIGADPNYAGKLGVACAEENDAIEFNVFNSKGAMICAVKIGPQAGIEGVGLTDGGGAEQGIGLEAEVKGVHYALSGSNCGTTPGSYSDGVLKGKPTLTATDEAGHPIDVWLAGEP